MQGYHFVGFIFSSPDKQVVSWREMRHRRLHAEEDGPCVVLMVRQIHKGRQVISIYKESDFEKLVVYLPSDWTSLECVYFDEPVDPVYQIIP